MTRKEVLHDVKVTASLPEDKMSCLKPVLLGAPVTLTQEKVFLVLGGRFLLNLHVRDRLQDVEVLDVSSKGRGVGTVEMQVGTLLREKRWSPRWLYILCRIVWTFTGTKEPS